MSVSVRRMFSKEWNKCVDAVFASYAREHGARYRDGTTIVEALMSKTDEKVEKGLRERLEACERAIEGLRACDGDLTANMERAQMTLDAVCRHAGMEEGELQPQPPPRDHSSCCGDGPLPLPPTEECRQLRKANENLEALVAACQRTAERHQNFTRLARAQVEVLRTRLRQHNLPDSVPE